MFPKIRRQVSATVLYFEKATSKRLSKNSWFFIKSPETVFPMLNKLTI